MTDSLPKIDCNRVNWVLTIFSLWQIKDRMCVS